MFLRPLINTSVLFRRILRPGDRVIFDGFDKRTVNNDMYAVSGRRGVV